MADYTFERITEDNLSSLILLAKDAFEQDFPLKYFEQKFATSWTGVKNIGYIALDEAGKTVGYYGMYPCFLLLNGKKILAAQVGDTMTHSQHRGKGLFAVLANKTYSLAKEEGIKFVFGFPNEQAYPGVVTKLNWVQKEFMHLYKVKVSTLPFAKIAFKLKWINPLFFSCINIILKKKKSNRTSFENSNIDNINGGILRDEFYFNYKKDENKFLLDILGTCVWIKIDGFLFVGDIERRDEKSYLKVLQNLKRVAKWIGATEILFQASPGSYMDRILSQQYSFQQGARIGYLSFDNKINGDQLKYTIADFDTF